MYSTKRMMTQSYCIRDWFRIFTVQLLTYKTTDVYDAGGLMHGYASEATALGSRRTDTGRAMDDNMCRRRGVVVAD